MKTYWLNHDKKREDYFKVYAAAFDRTILPEDSMITLVCEEKEVCGFSALSVDGDTAYIQFFLIFEEYRRKGFGTFLMKELSERLSGAGITMLHAVVPSDDVVCAFLEAEGFDFFPGEEEYEISFGELKYCEKYRKSIMGQPSGNALSFKDCTPVQKDAIRKILAGEGITEPRGYDMELSVAGFQEGKVGSIVLCERIAGGIIVRAMLFSESGTPRDLLHCLRAFNEKLCAEEGSSSLKLSFPAGINGNKSLIDFLTGFDIQVGDFNRGYVALKRIV